jgi:signal transduction histidine kinase
VRGLRLQHRIVIPFVLIALATITSAAWAALSAFSESLRDRVEAQLMSAASVAARTDFALSPAILASLRQVLGGEVVTIGPAGEVLATSLPDDRAALADAVVRGVKAAGVTAETAPVVVDVDCGSPCLVVYKGLDGRPGAGVALVADTSEVTATTQSVARTILIAMFLSIVVMVLVSQAVVRRVTSPLDRLVRFARELAPERSMARAPVGDNEVGVLAEAFNDMLDRLQHAGEALVRSEKLGLAGLLSARVAHDIRNPLSSIKMQTQLLRTTHGADAAAAATLDAILHDINQVESVIRDLLELARPGEFKLEPAAVDAVIKDALLQLAPQFRHRRIEVVASLAGDVPASALDTTRFRQALINVLVNASEAMPTGGHIAVTSRAAGGGVEVEVCDDGTGVEPDMIERVFDPFVSTKREGVGLGLVNARAVVEGHGGTIQLAQRQPRGTCVTIRLPGMHQHG